MGYNKKPHLPCDHNPTIQSPTIIDYPRYSFSNSILRCGYTRTFSSAMMMDNIASGYRKGRHRRIHRQQSDFISLLLFSQNKESRQKKI
jgi:hypothetical protein